MKQLTLRGFDPELERRLRELSAELSISLNRAALLLLRRGAGLAPAAGRRGTPGPVGSALDGFIGVWSEEEEREFRRSIAFLERVEPELWR